MSTTNFVNLKFSFRNQVADLEKILLIGNWLSSKSKQSSSAIGCELRLRRRPEGTCDTSALLCKHSSGLADFENLRQVFGNFTEPNEYFNINCWNNFS